MGDGDSLVWLDDPDDPPSSSLGFLSRARSFFSGRVAHSWAARRVPRMYLALLLMDIMLLCMNTASSSSALWLYHSSCRTLKSHFLAFNAMALEMQREGCADFLFPCSHC